MHLQNVNYAVQMYCEEENVSDVFYSAISSDKNVWTTYFLVYLQTPQGNFNFNEMLSKD